MPLDIRALPGERSGFGCVCREPGKVAVEPLRFLAPGPGEVRLEVHACGMCHSDLSVVNRRIPYPLPNLLGHEGAGVVEAVGEGVTDWKVGDRAILTMVLPCNRCADCLSSRPSLCKKRGQHMPVGRVLDASGKTLTPMAGLGCMAEYAVVNQVALIRVREDMPLDKGALVSCGVTTGVGAVMNCAKMEPGSSCCVIGCGGVGISAIQGAKISGASQIIAVDTMPSKLTAAKQFGATHCVNAKTVQNVVKEVARLSGGGTDYSFEAIGMPQTAEQAIEAVRAGGTAVIVGVADQKDRAKLKLAKINFLETVVKGSFMGSSVPMRFVPMLCDLYKKGDLLLDEFVSQYYSIQQACTAFDDLTSGVGLRGVIVMHQLQGLAERPTPQAHTSRL